MDAWRERLRDAVLCLLVLSICGSLFPSKSSGRVQSTMSHPGTAGVCNYSLLARCKPEPGLYPVWMQSRTQKHPIVLFCLSMLGAVWNCPSCVCSWEAEGSVRSQSVPGAPGCAPEPAVQRWARHLLLLARNAAGPCVLLLKPCSACGSSDSANGHCTSQSVSSFSKFFSNL